MKNIVSEIEISYKNKSSNKEKIGNSKDTYKCFKSIWALNKIEHKEMMYAMYLNRQNLVLAILLISEGGLTGTICDPRIIFQGALKTNASSIILAHNHPSGNMKPSEADIHITNKIVAGGKLLDYEILDHLILSPEDGIYYSFADQGRL